MQASLSLYIVFLGGRHSPSKESKMNLKSSLLIGFLAVGSSAMAQVAVDGIKGAEWNGVTGYHITHDDNAPSSNFSSVVATNNGASYTAYLRSDANYVYGLITETGDLASSPGNFANIYLNVDGYRSTAGSDLGFEVTNNDAFIPSTGAKSDLTGTGFTFANVPGTTAGLTGIEFAIPWSFLTNDPLNMGFPKTQAGDRVTFRTAQAYGYTASGYDATDPMGLNPNATADRLGHVVYAPVPEPASFAPLGLGAIALLRRRKRA